MKLLDNEIRDITRLLEEGKPLPDKYRFMLFGDDREIELVWNGKSSDVTNINLPFQTIEHVDEPRSEKDMLAQPDLFDMGTGRQLKGWTNKLIWGDNKFILSSLKNGPLRTEVESNGGIKLIYIDPPFDVGADFSINVEIGAETFDKDPNVLEELAYRDTWGKGQDSYLSMIYERIRLMRDLLSNDGSLMFHCDYRVIGLCRVILDEIFGSGNLVNELIWVYRQGGRGEGAYGQKHDTILWYRKGTEYTFNPDAVRIPYEGSGGYQTSGKGVVINGKVYKPNPLGKIPEDWWDIPALPPMSKERIGYPTQKPEKLIERIIEGSTKEGDIVCDFFVGSGTTASVAERLNRKWICSDLGKFSIHTSRKRLIGTQRHLKRENKRYRAFEVLNLGRYERDLFISGLTEIDKSSQQLIDDNREVAFIRLIIEAYQAEPISGFRTFRGKKNNRLVAIGSVDLPLSRLFAEEVLGECVEKGVTKADLLAFEFEMGLFPSIQDEASKKGVDLVLKHIPKEVFDKRALDRGEARFHDVAYIEVRPIINGNKVSIELTNYSVFYTQGITSFSEQNLRSGKSQIVVENGQVLKISKDKDGITNPREILTKNWHDWVDYWSIDFDFESKKELIYEKNPSTGQDELKWTGSYIFENEWQSFRTKQDRSIELKSIPYEMQPGRKKIAVKVVDIFGNDTMKVIDLTIGGKI